MYGVSRLWVIGFDIADVLLVPGVYVSTGLSYILLITHVAFPAVNTTRVLLVVWVPGWLFLYCVGSSEDYFYIGTFKQISNFSDCWSEIGEGYPFLVWFSCYWLKCLFLVGQFFL